MAAVIPCSAEYSGTEEEEEAAELFHWPGLGYMAIKELVKLILAFTTSNSTCKETSIFHKSKCLCSPC